MTAAVITRTAGSFAESAPARVAIVDIGSNSVRLVAYEGLTRAPAALFNEKVLCGLGRGVSTTGVLAEEAVGRALMALRGFRVLCRNMGIEDIHIIATAAIRDARNGEEVVARCEAAIGAPVQVIGGAREAELSALGVLSSFHRPDGVAGDMGGGSLELSDLEGTALGRGVSLPLGGLALLDTSRDSPKRAGRIARDALRAAEPIRRLNGRTFYAVGGTWRALAKLHMRQRNYPLDVMHGYVIPAAEAGAFAALVERVDADALSSIGAVSAARRPLLRYGAVVLDEVLRQGKPRQVVISAHGVREGLLFERLAQARRGEDPLIAAAESLNALTARDPAHGADLTEWTGAFIRSAKFSETDGEARLRRAACLLADVAWRAHPDDRSRQALQTIANGTFAGVDHADRSFLALAVAYRHIAPDEDVAPSLRGLLSAHALDRARILGAALRVAYLLSAAMGGVLPRTPLLGRGSRLTLTLPADLADLAGERLAGRLRQIGKLIGRESAVKVLE